MSVLVTFKKEVAQLRQLRKDKKEVRGTGKLTDK